MRNFKLPLEIDSHGYLIILSDFESLRQKIYTRLNLFKATWLLDMLAGVPYLQDILIRPVDAGLATSILNTEILKECEVIAIKDVDVSLDNDTRTFSYKATITTIYGETELLWP